MPLITIARPKAGSDLVESIHFTEDDTLNHMRDIGGISCFVRNLMPFEAGELIQEWRADCVSGSATFVSGDEEVLAELGYGSNTFSELV